jgi:A/G-specific adenine glycosylase
MAWGAKNRRGFAWRRTEDPYKVFVAELLVQRTKAAQVEPIYLNFLGKWRNLESLSEATQRDLKSVIGTLGLEYRVKRIRTIAQLIMSLFGGTIPDKLAELKRLYGSGFGDYMAHALLCFAFAQDVPVVDKNVERILKRVFSIETREDGHRDPKLWKFAAQFVPKGKAREYNWSLIDFGALVCTPKNPKCPTCSILGLCNYGRQRVSALRPV